MHKFYQQILRAMPVLFWIAIIMVTYLLLATISAPKIRLAYIDKIEHALVFIGLTTMGLIAWPHRKRTIFFGLTIFGGVMELAQQALTSYRQATWGDWAADTVGIVIALILFHYLIKHRLKNPSD